MLGRLLRRYLLATFPLLREVDDVLSIGAPLPWLSAHEARELKGGHYFLSSREEAMVIAFIKKATWTPTSLQLQLRGITPEIELEEGEYYVISREATHVTLAISPSDDVLVLFFGHPRG